MSQGAPSQSAGNLAVPRSLSGETAQPRQFQRPAKARSRQSAKSKNVGQSERWISMLAGAGLAALGLSSDRKGSLLLTAAGGALIYRGATGTCHLYQALGVSTNQHPDATAVPAQHGFKVEKTITVNRSASELYSFWREIENLPKAMKHLKNVDAIDSQRSHWVAEGVMGKDVEWDAEIFNDVENELIAWRSLPGGDVDTAGSVHFRPLKNDRGVEVTVSMKYNPPAGALGGWLAWISGSGVESKVADDLRNFKQLMETGEIATTEGQSRGGQSQS